MSNVAVLGLGAMGSRMAAALLRAGHAVTVWNRTAARADGLVGARLAASPRAAVAGAEVAIAMLRDDTASRAVWLDPAAGALGGLAQGAIAIECSTLTPAWIAELAETAGGHGVGFLDAPVLGSRPQAEAAQLIHLVGGDAAVLARAEPILRAIGGTIHHAGRAGAGAALKLAANTLFAIQVAAMAEVIGLLRGSGVEVAQAIDILGATPVASPAAKGAGAAMLAGAFAPLFPVDLVEKDLAYAAQAADAGGRRMPLAAAARQVMQAAIAQGLGDDNLTGIVRLYA